VAEVFPESMSHRLPLVTFFCNKGLFTPSRVFIANNLVQ